MQSAPSRTEPLTSVAATTVAGLGRRLHARSRSWNVLMKTPPVVRVLLLLVFLMGAVSGCGGGSAKAYDISPIFPLSSGKCARYGGHEEGSGVTATCMVTKGECEKAAADWKDAMQNGGVNEAIEFSCTSTK